MSGQLVLEADLFDIAEQALDTFPEPLFIDDFGPYRIIRQIGRGGMGEVFLAEDKIAGRQVALKFIGNLAAHSGLQRQFAREIQVLAQLEHSYIARLYGLGFHPNGTPYFELEYVEGQPVDAYCREQGCTLEQRLRIFQCICEAAQYAHSRAVIHLDIKPSNILVKYDGTPKLLDFGVAKHLKDVNGSERQTELLCTPDFAAPEQIRQEPVGTYTDVYALGVVLYELLARRHPYNLLGSSALQAAAATLSDDSDPAKPSASTNRVPASQTAWRDLDMICLKAIRKNPEQRYRSVLELQQDIARFLAGQPISARPATLAYRTSKFLRRNARLVVASLAVIALIVGLTAYYAVHLAAARDAAVAQTARAKHIQRFMVSIFGGDQNSAPSRDFRVIDMLETGFRSAQKLNNEPAAQADLFETLGALQHSLGELDRSDSLLKTALDKRRAIFGSDHPEFAKSLVVLAFLRIDQARFAEADRLARQAIDIDRRHLSPDNPDLGNAVYTLGSVLVHRGSYAEAIRVLEEAVRILSKNGPEDADLAESMTYLANAHYSLGHDAIAESLDRRILAIDRRRNGDRSPGVSEDLSNLALIEDQRGLYPEAERDHRQALSISEGWYGKNHFEAALVAEALAATLIHERKYEEASELLQQSLKTEERTVGKNHPFVAWALNLLGIIALNQGNLPEAEVDFNRMASIYKAVYGPIDKHAAWAQSRFAELYLAKNELPRSEQSFRKAIQIFTQALGADNIQTGTARIQLGQLLAQERRYPEAEAELLAGYQIVKRDSAPSLQTRQNARKCLASVYRALNKPEQAIQVVNDP